MNKTKTLNPKSGQNTKTSHTMNKKLMVILFRWINILIITILIFYKRGQFTFFDPSVIIVLFLLFSNAFLTFLKQDFFNQPKYIFLLILIDVVCISLAFRYISSENQLFLIFFAVLFISSIAQNVKWSFFIALIASIFYCSLIIFKQNADYSTFLNNPEFTLKIPFIFITAIWTSFWSEQYKKKKDQEERAQKFNKQLEQGIKKSMRKERKVLAELKRLKEYNENILRSLSSGVIVLDEHDTITMVNPKALEILQFHPRKLKNRKILEIDEMSPFQKLLEKLHTNGKKNGVHEIQLDSGKILNTTFSPLKGSKKENGVTIVFQDVTSIKTMKEQIRQSESLANLGKTLAWVAHEIRNLLTNITGYAQLLEMKYANNKTMKELTTPLIKSTERITVLMTDILDFSKQRQLKKEIVDIDILFEELKRTYANRCNGTELVFNQEKKSNLLISNYEGLRCVVSNLIRNAKDSIDENGGNGRIEIDLKKNKQTIKIEIADTGKGISEQNIKSIFNPFYTSKKSGTGLGLSIVKKIVESLEGSISVESKEGVGTTFKILFPSRN